MIEPQKLMSTCDDRKKEHAFLCSRRLGWFARHGLCDPWPRLACADDGHRAISATGVSVCILFQSKHTQHTAISMWVCISIGRAPIYGFWSIYLLPGVLSEVSLFEYTSKSFLCESKYFGIGRG